MLTFFILEIRT